MQEQGVSRVVEVDIDEAMRLAEPVAAQAQGKTMAISELQMSLIGAGIAAVASAWWFTTVVAGRASSPSGREGLRSEHPDVLLEPGIGEPSIDDDEAFGEPVARSGPCGERDVGPSQPAARHRPARLARGLHGAHRVHRTAPASRLWVCRRTICRNLKPCSGSASMTNAISGFGSTAIRLAPTTGLRQ